MLTQEAMTAHAEWIAPDLSLTETALRMRENNIGCLPVGENDRLIGMITDRDIVCRAVARGSRDQDLHGRPRPLDGQCLH